VNYVSFDWPATGDSPPTRDTPSQKRATPQKVSKNLNLGQTRQIPAKKHVSTSGITRQSVELDDEMSQSMQVCHRYVAGMSQVCRRYVSAVAWIRTQVLTVTSAALLLALVIPATGQGACRAPAYP